MSAEQQAASSSSSTLTGSSANRQGAFHRVRGTSRRRNSGRRGRDGIHALETLELRTGDGEIRRREGAGRNRGGGRGRRRGGRWMRRDRARGQGGTRDGDGQGGDLEAENEETTDERTGRQPVTVWRRRQARPGPASGRMAGQDGHNTDSACDELQATELTSSLTEKLNRGQLECIVCYDLIKRGKKIWSCTTCYIIMHLQCTIKWARASEEYTFRCPGCQAQYELTGVNQDHVEHRCFCGQVKNPTILPGVTPGSCNDICSRPRGALGCSHSCTLRCHPGPCPPCVVSLSPIACFCGKTKIPRRCGDRITDAMRGCGEICGKTRKECGHSCSRLCHPGKCESCGITVEVKCFCGKEHLKLPCDAANVDNITRGFFACNNICGRLKDCGNHTCGRSCHPGPCVCEFTAEAIETCACGARKMTSEERRMRRRCTDPLVSCGSVCGKHSGCVLDHKCPKICGQHGHDGECSSSHLLAKAICRCGSTVVSRLNCSEPPSELRTKLVCRKICNQRMSCGKHRCQGICCPLKRKKSDQWYRMKDINARVATRLWGNVQGTDSGQGHDCQELCDTLLNCNIHRCDLPCGHGGSCPPCGFLVHEPLTCACGAESTPPPVRCGQKPPRCLRPCQRRRPGCTHPCPNPCHTSPCPKCVFMVSRECVGGHHVSRLTPCFNTEISCAGICGRPLACGVHVCRNKCHKPGAPCEASDLKTRRCSQACGLPRATCSHRCESLCHGTEPCPESACVQSVTVRCPCRRKISTVPCCSLKKESSGTSQIDCDQECAAQQRLQAFAAAIRGHTSGKPTEAAPKYPQFLMEFAASERPILSHVEKEMEMIVDGRARKVHFDNLPLLHRQVVHALAEFYGLESESTGTVPNRRLVVRHRGPGFKPVVPNPRLSDAYQISMQQQRDRQRSPSFRRLWILPVPTSEVHDENFKEKDIPVALRSHKGYYQLLDMRLPMDSRAVLVEFSTPARMESAKASLSHRDNIVVKEFVEQESGP